MTKDAKAQIGTPNSVENIADVPVLQTAFDASQSTNKTAKSNSEPTNVITGFFSVLSAAPSNVPKAIASIATAKFTKIALQTTENKLIGPVRFRVKDIGRAGGLYILHGATLATVRLF
ncbi:MAG: hypothetical protein AAGF94_04655 [Pseudomonadota bacterium]